MNLIELFDSLSIPENGNGKTFSAKPIPEFPKYRVALNTNGYPVILLLNENDLVGYNLKNYRLKYLQLEQNTACKITENNKSRYENFTIITFKSYDRNLQEYFLRFSEILIKTLGNNSNQGRLVETLNKFVEIFGTFSDAPTKTIQGLWAELLIIETSRSPKVLLNYWHNIPEEKFDFNADIEKLEVKSSSNLERIHTFTSEQLNPLNNRQVLIASVFTKQVTNGLSIIDLIDSIKEKINNIELLEKLIIIIHKSLGYTFEDASKIKYDYVLAKSSLCFYKHQDISKIEKINIPNNVTSVHFKSDLSNISPINPINIVSEGSLFRSL